MIRKINTSGVVSTLAGGGINHPTNGPRLSANYSNPIGVAMDGSGNLFIADIHNNLIRKIDATGTVTTLAGNGLKGLVNGPGNMASFNTPIGVAADKFGNVYVADAGNHVIRKIDATGLVTTFAGSGTAGFANGYGIVASFNDPAGVATDAAGNVYVADRINNIIRKITPNGLVSTLAGTYSAGNSGKADGVGTNAKFFTPNAVCTDALGNVYVVDQGNLIIRKIDLNAVVTTIAGNNATGATDGIASVASFNWPTGVAADNAGNVFIADPYNNLIRKISPSGIVSTIAGQLTQGFKNGVGIEASFNLPYGITTDSVGNLYVADVLNNLIRKINITSGYSISPNLPKGLVFDATTGTISGTPKVFGPLSNYTITAYNASGINTTTFNLTITLPDAPVIAYNSTQTYNVNKQITALVPINTGGAVPATVYGQVSTFAGNGQAYSSNGNGVSASFNSPSGVSTDVQGNIYVADQGSNLIRRIDQSANVSNFAGNWYVGSANGLGTLSSFNSPSGLTTDSQGNTYVADSNNNLIRKIDQSGNVTTFAGSGTVGAGNGSGTAASFNNPNGVITDKTGNIYVADKGNNLIRKITSTGIVTTFAGNGSEGNANGNSTVASFHTPTDVAIDTAGNIYVADSGNNLIRKITTNGFVTTLAGDGTKGSLDGSGTAASFNNPSGLAIDAAANIYVTDNGSQRIRKITPLGVVTTLAGSGSPGSTNGIGISASFNSPAKLTADAGGDLYVADYSNNLIRKISITGYSISPTLPVGLNFDATTGAISGVPTSASALSKYTVIGYNLTGSSTATFSLEVTSLSNEASLNNLTLNVGTLSPSFAPNNVNYSVIVSNTTNSFTLTPTIANTKATMQINGKSAISGMPFTTNLDSNNNLIQIVVTAQDGITTQTYTIIVVNSIFTLPATNFNITTTSETCNGSSNGSIAVAASASLNYTAVLTGNGINTTQKFTDSVNFANLPTGTYTLTFTIDGQANYSSSYTVNITQPQPLSVYATVNDAAGNIDLNLSGGSVYHIQLNNKTYITNESSFSVPMETGNNSLQVTTDRECQGIFTKVINPSYNISPYPMPFVSTLNLNLGNSNLATVGVRIYSANTGLQVFRADYQNQSGVLQLDLSKLQKGAYGLQLIINNTQKEFKIIK